MRFSFLFIIPLTDVYVYLQKVEYLCIMWGWKYPVGEVKFLCVCSQKILVIHAIGTAARIVLSTCSMAGIMVKAPSALISLTLSNVYSLQEVTHPGSDSKGSKLQIQTPQPWLLATDNTASATEVLEWGIAHIWSCTATRQTDNECTNAFSLQAKYLWVIQLFLFCRQLP